MQRLYVQDSQRLIKELPVRTMQPIAINAVPIPRFADLIANVDPSINDTGPTNCASQYSNARGWWSGDTGKDQKRPSDGKSPSNTHR